MEDIGIVNREIGPKWMGPLPVYVSENDLPALLARLTAAAEGMWVETLLVKSLEEAKAHLVDHMPAHALRVIEQALASVK